MRCSNCLYKYYENREYCPNCGVENLDYEETLYIDYDQEQDETPRIRKINLDSRFAQDDIARDYSTLDSGNVSDEQYKPIRSSDSVRPVKPVSDARHISDSKPVKPVKPVTSLKPKKIVNDLSFSKIQDSRNDETISKNEGDSSLGDTKLFTKAEMLELSRAENSKKYEDKESDKKEDVKDDVKANGKFELDTDNSAVQGQDEKEQEGHTKVNNVNQENDSKNAETNSHVNEPSKLGLAIGGIVQGMSSWSKRQQERISDWQEKQKILAEERRIQAEKEAAERARIEEAERIATEQRAKAKVERAEREAAEEAIRAELEARAQAEFEAEEATRLAEQARLTEQARFAEAEKQRIFEERREEARRLAAVERAEEERLAELEYKMKLERERREIEEISKARGNSGTESYNDLVEKNEKDDATEKKHESKHLKINSEDISEPKQKSFDALAWIKNAFEWVLIRIRAVHIFIALGVLALIIAFFILRGSASPVEPFIKALDSRNYEQAGELYSSYINDKEKVKLADESLQEYLLGLKKNAVDGKTTYAATYSALEAIKSSKIYKNNAVGILDKTSQDILDLQQINIVYERAVEKQKELDYSNAILEFNKVTEAYPNYRDVNDRLAELREKFREQVVRQVSTLQSQGNYVEAAAAIDEALTLLPKDPMLSSLKNDNLNRFESALYKETQAQAEKFFQGGKYQDVFTSISTALEKEPDNQALLRLKAAYESKCAESILNTADSIFNKGDKEAAMQKIEEGLAILPSNKLLSDARDRYELSDEDLEGKNSNSDDNDDNDDKRETQDDGLNRSTYNDAAGESHSDSVNINHQFTGSLDVVESIKFKNVNSGNIFKGELLIGEVDAYTQVYYQVYSSANLSSPIMAGSLYAGANGEVGENYKVRINATATGADYFVVNLNYLKGNNINVVLDLGYTG